MFFFQPKKQKQNKKKLRKVSHSIFFFKRHCSFLVDSEEIERQNLYFLLDPLLVLP